MPGKPDRADEPHQRPLGLHGRDERGRQRRLAQTKTRLQKQSHLPRRRTQRAGRGDGVAGPVRNRRAFLVVPWRQVLGGSRSGQAERGLIEPKRVQNMLAQGFGIRLTPRRRESLAKHRRAKVRIGIIRRRFHIRRALGQRRQQLARRIVRIGIAHIGRRNIRRQARQARGMGGQHQERDLVQPRQSFGRRRNLQVFGDRIVAVRLARALALGQQQRGKDLGDRTDLELRVRRDRSVVSLGEVPGLKELHAFLVHPGDRNAAGFVLVPGVNEGLHFGGGGGRDGNQPKRERNPERVAEVFPGQGHGIYVHGKVGEWSCRGLVRGRANDLVLRRVVARRRTVFGYLVGACLQAIS